eukprot:5764082-Pyramimonas_sp.AAC.1
MSAERASRGGPTTTTTNRCRRPPRPKAAGRRRRAARSRGEPPGARRGRGATATVGDGFFYVAH